MIAALFEVLDLHALFLIAVLLLFVRAFSKMVAGNNPVESWHFYASRSPVDGRQYGDPNKLALMIGVVASTLMVAYMFYVHRAVDYNWYMV